MVVLSPSSSLSYISWNFCDPVWCGTVHHDNTDTGITKRINRHFELLEWLCIILVLWMPQILAQIWWLQSSEYQWYGRQHWQQWTWQKWKRKHRWYGSRIVVYSIFVTKYLSNMFISHLLSRIYIHITTWPCWCWSAIIRVLQDFMK